jgi:hypothetical protein
MIREEFEAQLGRLTANFGKNALTEERVTLIHKAVKDLTAHEFKKIVDHFISNFRQAPLPKDFFEASRQEVGSRVRKEVEACVSWAEKGPQPEQRERLKLVFAQNFDGAETSSEALEVAKRRIREGKKMRTSDDDEGPGAA